MYLTELDTSTAVTEIGKATNIEFSVVLTALWIWMLGSKADIQWTDAVDQWCIRRILDIRWHDFVRNADIRRISRIRRCNFNTWTFAVTHELSCVSHSTEVVRCVANYSVSCGRCVSPAGRNALYCMNRYNATLSDVLSPKFANLVWERATKDTSA